MVRAGKLFFLLVILTTSIKSQDFLGYINSNYSGVNGINLNPASIADSRYKVDVNLIGASGYLYNNYVGMLSDAFKEEGAFDDTLFKVNYLRLKETDKSKSLFLRNNFELPSVMVSITPKDAIGFSWRIRNYINIDGVEQEMADLIYNDFSMNNLYNKSISNERLSAQFMSWSEVGFSYARVLLDKERNFMKAGVRAKIIRGIAGGYLFVDNLNYKIKNNDTISIENTTVRYGVSDNLDFSGEGNIKFGSSRSLGLDVGFVYEYRPNWKKYRYEMDGDTNLVRRDKNKYKLRLGLSILDIGGVKFTKSSTSSDYYANVSNMALSELDVEDTDELSDSLAGIFQPISSSSTFKMNLPTAICAQIDYNIYKDFYINFTPYIAFKYKKNENKVHDFTTISITPRWDHKWFGVFLPVSHNGLTGTNLGVSFRLGPVIFGTTDVLPIIGTRDIYGVDFHLTTKIPIFFKHPRDKDKDKISNKKDKCREIPGIWKFQGCPDCDKDGIEDSKDACPDDAGIPEFNGCPDTDGDKLMDKLDSCPEVPGLIEFNGCPDKDGDKIIDMRDSCPDVPGIKQFNGCPDKDMDGVQDSEDACPNDAGPIEQKGCPDTDKDGIFDNEDLCPAEFGTKENKGCPFPDKDGDGVFDKDDKCPETVGVKENFGCPVLQKEEQEVINTAFSSLEFETGKDVIKQNSYASLEELAKLLTKKSAWQLKLSGHTDNQGNPKKNMKLSELRAKAVKKFIVEKGVGEERVIAEWFGQTKPVANNKTPEGRQKNRRVEMNIIFK
ncbi:MAG: OmpA family protein [Bacteroidetes bacterium]|nr:OmpA family protein [Bacteroidota bacterium]